MPFISKTKRQSDYNLFPSTHPIVIDNGASYFRIGWAGETEPRVIFRNIVQRPRHKTTGEVVTIVGDHDPAFMKYFDCTRSGPRSAFDSNVVYQFEIMEYILDFGFDRLGADSSLIDHPVLITECFCNPVQSRSKMAELLFETYGVPSVAFGVDAAFSYKYNEHLGICGKDGLAICSGFTTSHAIPFLNGEPVYDACLRTNIGGYHVTDSLKELLSLKYPHHMSKLTWEKAEDLKMENCYIAHNYASEVRLFQKGGKEAEKKTRCWQLPWTPSPVEEPPSEEEIARKAALKERQGQRLREMAEAKRVSRVNELENEFKGLEFLLQQLKHVEESGIPSFLARTGYVSKKEIDSAFVKAKQSLQKAKGEQVESEENKDPLSAAEKYSLVNVPDNNLTPDQLKEKRRQLFLKTTSEGRLRARQKRLDEEVERDKQSKQDEEKRLENPEQYLEQTRNKYKELSEKVEQRKRLKTNGGNHNGNHNGSGSGSVGRGERLNSAQKERMRLLTTAAFDRGKGEDTFGIKDEDWQLYKLMSKDNDDDDEGPDEDEAELSRISSRLKEIDPTFVPKPDPSSSITEVPRLRPLTKEDFQIIIGVERFRCPEILFNPNLIGIDQAGLDEMGGVSIRRLPSNNDNDNDKEQAQAQAQLEDRITNSILMTGGSCLLEGTCERIEGGIRMLRPCGAPIRVVKASDPVLDAWRGASAYASCLGFPQQTFSKMDYDEKGEDWLSRYQLMYSLITPSF